MKLIRSVNWQLVAYRLQKPPENYLENTKFRETTNAEQAYNLLVAYQQIHMF